MLQQTRKCRHLFKILFWYISCGLLTLALPCVLPPPTSIFKKKNVWEKLGKIGCFSMLLWADQWNLSGGIENGQSFGTSQVLCSSPGLIPLTWMPAIGVVFKGLSTLTLQKTSGVLFLASCLFIPLATLTQHLCFVLFSVKFKALKQS